MVKLISYNAGEIIIPLDAAAEMFYHDHMPLLEEGQTFLASEMEKMRRECTAYLGRDPFGHWNIRIKSASSAKSKLQRLGYSTTPESAVTKLHDIIGARIVCTFIDDIYLIRKWLGQQSSTVIEEERDYIKHPKPNGYRSCHLIVRIPLHGTHILAEIQLRTLAMDCWATLEHQLKYKNEKAVQELIIRELKRCSDEIASTDWNLLAIREMVEGRTGTDERLPLEEDSL